MKTRFGLFLLTFSVALRANHPVLVEGNCNVPPFPSSTVTLAGTCGDFDGDGRIGADEDNDGDRVFGTIAAALGAGLAANQNGMVTIVTSGTFAEAVSITAANGNVTLQAAPGVVAIIDAVLGGDPGNVARQNNPGIVVNSPSNRYVILRNLISRNWTSGIRVAGASRVTIENCILENNVAHGIEVLGTARVVIDDSQVIGSGFRAGANPNNAANPGRGVSFGENSTGALWRTRITGSAADGVFVDSTSGKVSARDLYLFDNANDTTGPLSGR
ncbi:MAG: right-handed parallel beta-helix repeat-containing protein [Bryobacteraceae bacterium]